MPGFEDIGEEQEGYLSSLESFATGKQALV